MKDIKDYLHLYIGCEVQYPDIDGSTVIAKLTGMTNGDGIETTYLETQRGEDMVGDYLAWKENGNHHSNAFNLKLLLRPLSDMTEEEAIEIGELVIGKYDSVKFRVDKNLSTSGEFRYWKVHKEHRGYGKSLTIDENGEVDVYDRHDDGSHTIYIKQHFVTKYLLSKGFDLFNLINDGLALDKTNL